MNTNTESPAIAGMYDNLLAFRDDGDDVYVVNNADGFRFLTVAVADAGGDAGGDRVTTSTPHRLYPGLNRVSAGYWARVEADAARQRKRIDGGGTLSKMLDSGTIKRVKDIDKASAENVDSWLAKSGDLETIGHLRNHPKHRDAALRHFDAWHSNEASHQVKLNRHFWAMSTNSKKVA